MGWTTMHVEPDISGKIDRKSILEDEISDDYEILKSQMVGSTYDISEPALIAGRYTLAELTVPNSKAVRA